MQCAGAGGSSSRCCGPVSQPGCGHPARKVSKNPSFCWPPCLGRPSSSSSGRICPSLRGFRDQEWLFFRCFLMPRCGSCYICSALVVHLEEQLLNQDDDVQHQDQSVQTNSCSLPSGLALHLGDSGLGSLIPLIHLFPFYSTMRASHRSQM